jgi:hypothetical protein
MISCYQDLTWKMTTLCYQGWCCHQFVTLQTIGNGGTGMKTNAKGGAEAQLFEKQ